MKHYGMPAGALWDGYEADTSYNWQIYSLI